MLPVKKAWQRVDRWMSRYPDASSGLPRLRMSLVGGPLFLRSLREALSMARTTLARSGAGTSCVSADSCAAAL